MSASDNVGISAEFPRGPFRGANWRDEFRQRTTCFKTHLWDPLGNTEIAALPSVARNDGAVRPVGSLGVVGRLEEGRDCEASAVADDEAICPPSVGGLETTSRQMISRAVTGCPLRTT